MPFDSGRTKPEQSGKAAGRTDSMEPVHTVFQHLSVSSALNRTSRFRTVFLFIRRQTSSAPFYRKAV
ncbi:hypothetical protein NEISICOT_03241 [Neisseria sicca ATCC 29256]|uniref:Uncharacterized protein n=1 Tax=Neisseria sicca ATCC 29256 TaxID=547045 RepID=C6M9L4_NEISI|nr:hypothetical protein NEISICOT_03241 [Neisseria sicca ATCC 29256]